MGTSFHRNRQAQAHEARTRGSSSAEAGQAPCKLQALVTCFFPQRFGEVPFHLNGA